MQRSILYGTVLGKTSLGELRTYQDAKGNPYTAILVVLPIEDKEKQIMWERQGYLQIQHSPHLRKLIDYKYDKDQKNKLLLFEQIDGISLERLISDRRKKGEKLKENEIVDITFQIIKALFHLHQCNLLGRYFTPESIIIQANKQIVMMEYGFAGPLLPQKVKPIQPPEVLDFELYDYKIDVWLLGNILSFLSLGEQVFSKQPDYNYQSWHKPKEFLNQMEGNSVHIQSKTLSDDLKGLIQGMLIFDPEKRWTFDIILENEVFKLYKTDPIYKQMIQFYRRFPDNQALQCLTERIKISDEQFLNKLYMKFRSRRAKSTQNFETDQIQYLLKGKTRYLQKQKYFNYSFEEGNKIKINIFFDCHKEFALIPEELQPEFQKLGYQVYIIQQLLYVQTSITEFNLKVETKIFQYWISTYIVNIIDDTLTDLGKLNIVRQETNKFANSLRSLKDFHHNLTQYSKIENRRGDPKQLTRELLLSHMQEMRKLDIKQIESSLSPYYQIRLIDLNFRIYLCLLHDIIFKDAETVNKYFKKIQQFHGVRQLKDYIMIETFLQRAKPHLILQQMEEFAEILQK